MKICKNCGTQNPDSGKFCSNCAAPLDDSELQAQQQYYQQSSYQQQQPIVIQEKKKIGCFPILLIVLGTIFLFAIFLGIIGMTSDDSDDSDDTTTQIVESTSVYESKNKNDKQETSKKQEKGVYTLDDVELKFKSSKVVKEEYGDYYYLIINFEYTNNSSSSKAFDECVTIKAFQSGVELQSPISTYGIPDYDFHYSEKEVKPGVTITVQEAFRLDDLKNSVSIELYDGIYFINEPDYEFEVKIDK